MTICSIQNNTPFFNHSNTPIGELPIIHGSVFVYQGEEGGPFHVNVPFTICVNKCSTELCFLCAKIKYHIYQWLLNFIVEMKYLCNLCSITAAGIHQWCECVCVCDYRPDEICSLCFTDLCR